MKFFPYENFYINTSLSPDQVKARLEEVVSVNGSIVFTYRGISDGGANTPFKGYVDDEKFAFKPNIIYHNSFLPQIKGSIEGSKDGSRVHVRMTLYIFMSIIVFIVLAGSGIACVILFPDFINHKPPAVEIAPYFVFMLTYLLAAGAFKSESISSKSFLVELLEGEIE